MTAPLSVERFSRAPKLVLASASPRRRDLLAQIGVEPDAIRPADIDETPRARELPRAYAERMAGEKLAAARAQAPIDERDALTLASDTVVALGRRILGKPADAAEAEAFLRALSGRRHQVLTAVAAARGGRTVSRLAVARVRMKRLSDAEIAWYLAGGEWRGKAGGYGVQGAAAAFIPWISGSYSAIVGLPLAETAQLLSALGLPVAHAPA